MSLTALIATLNHPSAGRVLSILYDASLKGSVLLLLACLMTRVLRGASAAVRHLVWSAALGGMLAIPLLATIVPRVPVAILRPIAAVGLPMQRASRVEAETPRARAVDEPSSPRAKRGPAVVSPRASSSSAAEPLGAPSVDLIRLLPMIWLVVAVLVLLRVALGALRVTLWSQRARPVADGAWLSLVHQLAARLRINRPLTLLRSEAACVPMTWGVVYPTVLLPADADAWTSERRTIVLLHELAHVKRFDALTQLLAQIVVAVFWFNPLVWLAARQMRTEREHACDDFVLEGGARATDYAYDLLQIARSLGGGATPSTALAMARRSELEGRLLAILDPEINRRNVSLARLAMATLSVLALAAPLAAFAPSTQAQRASAVVAPEIPAPRAQRRTLARTPAPRLHPWVALADTARRMIPERSLPAPSAIASPRATLAPVVTTPLPPVPEHVAPDRETLIAVAHAASKMTSDYEKAELLVSIAKYYVHDDDLCTIYLDAASSIKSDYDRSRTLLPLLGNGSLSASGLARVVQVAASMTSDNTKATLLVKAIADDSAISSPVRDALIAAASAIRSDYERGRTIAAIAAHTELTNRQTIDLIGVSAAMTSSYEKANALVSIATSQSVAGGDVRRAFVKAAETITSSSDYRRAVSTILR